MATVTQSTPVRKVFRATLRDEAGLLTKVNNEILFFNDVTGEITPIEPEDCVWLCVLGNAGIADAQAVKDRARGGFAKISCARMQEVA
jgi:hypothetical protein